MLQHNPTATVTTALSIWELIRWIHFRESPTLLRVSSYPPTCCVHPEGCHIELLLDTPCSHECTVDVKWRSGCVGGHCKPNAASLRLWRLFHNSDGWHSAQLHHKTRVPGRVKSCTLLTLFHKKCFVGDTLIGLTPQTVARPFQSLFYICEWPFKFYCWIRNSFHIFRYVHVIS